MPRDFDAYRRCVVAALALPLTPAEAKVAMVLTEGLQAQDMAQRFDVARTTIAFHMRNIFQKAATTRQTELVAWLLRPGLPLR